MFDTMTVTKIAGAFFGALLIFLLLNWAASVIYSTKTGSRHGPKPEVAYLIEVEDDSAAAPAEEAVVIDVAALVAAGDVERGTRVFKSCAACHGTTPGARKSGPTLFSVVGRDVGSVEGFNYSSAMSGFGGQWTVEALFAFLTRPKEYVPGTIMGFRGIKKDSDKANLIAYLQTLGG
jgi:cytochrome c